MKFKTFDYIFFFILIVDTVAIYLYPGLRLISKPLVVSSLLIYYVIETVQFQKPIVMTALIFALVGDIFLLFDFPSFFIAGIVSFLLMQLLYFKKFFQYYKKPEGIKKIYSYGVILLALAFNLIFYNQLGDYKIPVMVYSLAIAIMAFAGINQTLSPYILYGSLLFVVSDFTLALNKFVVPFKPLEALIMITYGLAQYFIVKGLVADKKM